MPYSASKKLYTLFLPWNWPPFFLYLLAGLLVLLVVLFLLQRRLVYYAKASRCPLQSVVRDAEHTGMTLWPSDSAYRGLLAQPSPDIGKGTVVVFHGNAGTAFDRSYYAEHLVPLGYNVILLEYPGYGPRDGARNETSLVSDAVESVKLIHEQFNGPIYLLGESLGSGVASEAAAAMRDSVDGILLITPFDSLPRVAQSIFWFLPVKWLVLDKFNSVAHLKGFKGPMGVVMAENDEIVPKTSTMTLFDSFGGKKNLWVIPRAQHNTWCDSVNAKWWQEVMAFISAADE